VIVKYQYDISVVVQQLILFIYFPLN
jgi:hypothetical protein